MNWSLLVAATGEALPHPLSVIPFIALLLAIATGPLFYPRIWERYYPIIALVLGAPVIVYYLFVLNSTMPVIQTAFEFLSFLSLIGALYIASSGIFFEFEGRATPKTNVMLLALGAVLANIIGTTGASILLIRPYMRLNRFRIAPFHIVFFIFIVSNMGGSLTPIGDPPLFVGFLKGVPFFWSVVHLFPLWLVGVTMVLALFYWLDSRHFREWLRSPEGQKVSSADFSISVRVVGKRSFFWLAVIIGAVFLDPAIFPWLPAISIHGEKFSIVREVIMITVAILAYVFASKKALKGNEFNFEPIREVGFLFAGIFASMIPALQLIASFAHSPEGMKIVNHHTLYWFTGSLSMFLDNTPTYLNFLSAAMGKAGLDIMNKADVLKFVELYPVDLMAISISAVFFGAMTYIGNAPNFMVRNLAEQAGIDMPSFFGYLVRYALIFLAPVLLIVYLLFFVILYG